MIDYLVGGGIVVFLLGLVIYYRAKGRREGWLFLSGFGAGIAAGAFIAYLAITVLLDNLLP